MSEKRTAEEILKAQYKRQNDHIREKYDRVSIALPKGTKDRITALNESLNAFIVGATLKALDAREKGADGPQDQEQKPAPTPDRLHAIEAEKKPTPDADEVQKMIDEKRKQYEREKEAEQTQEDAQKTRLFNMSDYK